MNMDMNIFMNMKSICLDILSLFFGIYLFFFFFLARCPVLFNISIDNNNNNNNNNNMLMATMVTVMAQRRCHVANNLSLLFKSPSSGYISWLFELVRL